jgi:hypothetical protein
LRSAGGGASLTQRRDGAWMQKSGLAGGRGSIRCAGLTNIQSDRHCSGASRALAGGARKLTFGEQKIGDAGRWYGPSGSRNGAAANREARSKSRRRSRLLGECRAEHITLPKTAGQYDALYAQCVGSLLLGLAPNFQYLARGSPEVSPGEETRSFWIHVSSPG